MKNRISAHLLLLAIAAASLAGCKKDSDAATCPDTVVGSWKLVSRQCFCVPAAMPQETLVLQTSGRFIFYRDGQPTSSGTYMLGTTASSCGSTASKPGIYFDAGARPAGVGYSLTNCKLILDYGGPCDAPVDTYERQ